MVKEKIEFSKQAMAGGSEYSKPIENEIGSNLDTLRQQVGEAAQASDKAQQGQGLGSAPPTNVATSPRSADASAAGW